METFDLVVLGAGPGGSATAIWAAMQGLRVALVEAQTFPRWHPGETLHPGVEPILRQLEVWEAVEAAHFLRPLGHWVAWGGTLRFEPYGADADGAWQGYQAWRETFDSILLERTRTLGVTLLQPCRAIRPCCQEERVTGVLTTEGTLMARWIVDACGGRHWLARHLGLEVCRMSPPLWAEYGYTEAPVPTPDGEPLLEGDATGWVWQARVQPDRTHWVKLRFPSASVPPESARRAEVTWRMVRECAGRGWFLVGDSAAVMDPITGHGVLRALMTGMMAAHQIAGMLGGEQAEEQTLAGYRAWLQDWFQADVRRVRKFYTELCPTWEGG